MTNPLALYDSRLNDAAPVASSTATGFDVLNLRDYRPYTWWKPSAIPATVTVDCGASVAADYLAVYAHELGSTGCTIEVRKSSDNFAANDVLVATYTPTDDKPIVVLFTSTSSRYWRLRITTGTAPQMAIALLGRRLEFTEGLDDGFDPLGRETRAQYNVSVKGQPLGKVINYEEWSETIQIPLVTWSWLRDTFLPAWEAHLRSEPWLFSWNPDSYPKETWLVAATGGFKGPHRPGSYADLSIPVSGRFPD
jgi:hypothetical protein